MKQMVIILKNVMIIIRDKTCLHRWQFMLFWKNCLKFFFAGLLMFCWWNKGVVHTARSHSSVMTVHSMTLEWKVMTLEWTDTGDRHSYDCHHTGVFPIEFRIPRSEAFSDNHQPIPDPEFVLENSSVMSAGTSCNLCSLCILFMQVSFFPIKISQNSPKLKEIWI